MRLVYPILNHMRSTNKFVKETFFLSLSLSLSFPTNKWKS